MTQDQNIINQPADSVTRSVCQRLIRDDSAVTGNAIQ